MKKNSIRNILFFLLFINHPAQAQSVDNSYDVVIYGATSAGVIAAVAAKQNGASVMLLSPEKHVGGLTTSGLGWTDIGNQDRHKTIGGLTLDFFHRIRNHYQNAYTWKEEAFADYQEKAGNSIYKITDSMMWTFEPHAAEKVFNDLITENKIPLKTDQWLDRKHGVKKINGNIVSITMLNGNTYRGKVFIDATYEGDLMAAAGVSYTTGREANSQYDETINGIETALATKNNLPRGIDPYVQKGDPSSGLLPGIRRDAGGKDGEGDKKIQAYCYRVCLTDVPANRIMVAKPANYQKRDFELIVRAAQKGVQTFWKLSPLPNRKTDSNNDGGVSTDYIGMDYSYPEASYALRRKMDEEHAYWTKGLIWTVQHDPGIPAEVRKKYASWGLHKDEFKDNGHMPYKLYVREARRMVSDFVMSENYLKGDKAVPESIAMGNYNMDSHNVQRYVTPDGDVQDEGDVEIGVKPPYGISYRAIVPKRNECSNLLVPVCLSASHVAYGSIRMEPVFMMLGQSSGIAAAFAVRQKKKVQDISYAELQKKLVNSGMVLRF
ncbi:MAG: FAD-dependent oxidoreductase [Bacteroidota bacterium]|nr:FAD-dependent oxidoreductase [Bacteroidota bacterium]